MHATVQVGRSDTGTAARLPDETGFVERDGVRVYWESFGHGDPTLLLLPPWSIVHSRCWKLQVPYLSRYFRIVTFDGRGNGLSDRPNDWAAYLDAEFVEDAAAVLDAAGVEAAFLVGLSAGGRNALQFATRYPQRVLGQVLIGPRVPFDDPPAHLSPGTFFDERDSYEGWDKVNFHYWQQDWPGFVDFWMSKIFTEPHSTKQLEDSVAWGLDTDAETIFQTVGGAAQVQELGSRTLCGINRGRPLLVIHGTDDQLVSFQWGRRVAEMTGGELAAFEGSGHGPHAREPVRVNLLIRDFVDTHSSARRRSPRSWRRVSSRPRRALFVSSPIGLGHAWRDISIADELRRQVPGIEVEWLAQDPVTTVLCERGETIHPAGAELAVESDHVDSEAGDHDLHAFQMLRRMDEILCANFMVFHDLVSQEWFDVWVADEAWELDHFLHENPELKTSPFVWMTDFVGYLPMPDGGSHEAFLTADYNAEMIDHVERLPRVRDLAVYFGAPDDLVPERFGPGLPAIRDWTARHYRMAGYAPGFDPAALGSREQLRASLGWAPDERVCVVSVGGSGVGEPLLRRVVEALPLVPNLRMVAVTGPRIDPASIPAADGLEVYGYVHELRRMLAACDVAVVQQGLTTTMELVVTGRPFLSLPLAHHFEQRYHVRHRLDRHGARDWLDWEDATPEAIAAAIERLIGVEPAYAPVPNNAASRAAGWIGELIGSR